jgi:hypothetical protein
MILIKFEQITGVKMQRLLSAPPEKVVTEKFQHVACSHPLSPSFGRKLAAVKLLWGKYDCELQYVYFILESVNKLAGEGRDSASDMILNDPYVWISPGDKYASKIVKEAICWFDPGQRKVVGGTPWGGGMPFGSIGGNLFSDHFLISYCFIAYGPISNVPLETTPLAFTRGLCTDRYLGTKKPDSIAVKAVTWSFVMGHVTWFDGSRPAKFLKWDQSGYTSDIRYAVSLNSEITCGHETVYKGDITWDHGKG